MNFFFKSQRVNESLKSLSVYSLEKDERKAACLPQETSAAVMDSAKSLIYSIQEDTEDSMLTEDDSIGILGQHKNFSRREKTPFRRINSVELYGKCKYFSYWK